MRDDDDAADASTDAVAGFPSFEHSQWTFEGEVERLGAFGGGGAAARGWKRAVAVFVAVMMVAPLLAGVVATLWHVLR